MLSASILRLLPGLPGLFGWMDRVAALGHGSPQELTGAEALRIAATSAPADPEPVSSLRGLSPGADIVVTPDDTGRDPVVGRLLAADAHEIILRCEAPGLGTLNLHVPRAGFDAALATR